MFVVRADIVPGDSVVVAEIAEPYAIVVQANIVPGDDVIVTGIIREAIASIDVYAIIIV